MTNDDTGTTDYRSRVREFQDLGWDAEQILYRLGHPNIVGRPARRAVRKMRRRGLTPDEALFGRRAVRREREVMDR